MKCIQYITRAVCLSLVTLFCAISTARGQFNYFDNTITGDAASAGGDGNTVSGHYGFVGGGLSHYMSGYMGFIGAGNDHSLYSSYGCILGGQGNVLTGPSANSFIGGGGYNTISTNWAVIGGGYFNNLTAGGIASFIGGGAGNSSDSTFTTSGGGYSNLIASSSAYSVIGGGELNKVVGSAADALIAGGKKNTNCAPQAVIGGGELNFADSQYSTIPGGLGAKTSSVGELAHANGYFTKPGDAQESTFILRGTSTSSTAVELFLDGSSAKIQMAPNSVWVVDVMVVGKGASHNAYFRTSGVFVSDSNGTATGQEFKVVVGANSGRIVDDQGGSADIFVGATGTSPNTKPGIRVQGYNGDTMKWVAVFRVAQVSN